MPITTIQKGLMPLSGYLPMQLDIFKKKVEKSNGQREEGLLKIMKLEVE